jgi:hypothetical protein
MSSKSTSASIGEPHVGIERRHEVVVGLQAEVEHPLRLVLELRDLLDELAGQPLRRLVQVVLGVVEAVALRVVGVDVEQRILLGDDLGCGHESPSLQSRQRD